MKKVTVILSVIICIVCLQGCINKTSNTDDNGYQIKGEELQKTINKLCSKEFAGRRSGDEKYFKAADYVVQEFKDLGIKSITGDDYFQYFDVKYSEIDTPYAFCVVNNNEIVHGFEFGTEYAFFSFSGTGDITAPVVYCGYAMHQPDDGYDDFENLDIKGKIALMFVSAPIWKKEGVVWAPSNRVHKAKYLKELGALGIIYVPRNSSIQALGSVSISDADYVPDLPMVIASTQAVDKMLLSSGKTIKELQQTTDSLQSPYNFDLGISVHIQASVTYFPAKPTVNIYGVLEGSDEKLKNEYIYVIAHFDHLGDQCNGEIFFPGANDNGSGSAAVLNIAKTFAKKENRPKRSVIFGLIAAEEMGLIGAKYFAENPPVPIEQTVAAFNMDCIGYGDSIRIYNGLGSPKLDSIARKLDSEDRSLLIDYANKGGGTDAIFLGQKGVPYLCFVTKNSYDLIHQVKDTPESLNMPLFETTVNLVYKTAAETARGGYFREE